MITKDKILEIAQNKEKIVVSELSSNFSVSRQYLNRLIQELVAEGKLVKVGETKAAFYSVPNKLGKQGMGLSSKYSKSIQNVDVEEHIVLSSVEQAFPALKTIPENVYSVFTYAFSEMLNNAIEHSETKGIKIEVSIQNKSVLFTIEDSGIGVFRNVMNKRKLKSEIEAIQDILKGKTTTMPKAHSGEGIFFTSKVGNLFMLDSYGYQLFVNNEIPDVFIQQMEKIKKGTRVTFSIKTTSPLHLNDIFMKFTNISPDSDYGFDKTEITVKLYIIGGIHISRSQARRVLAGLEKFHIILFDFDKVPTIGQAFADEIFRVFHNKHPKIKLETANMNEGVNFMIERAINEAKNR